jgi:hypothetical protein
VMIVIQEVSLVCLFWYRNGEEGVQSYSGCCYMLYAGCMMHVNATVAIPSLSSRLNR